MKIIEVPVFNDDGSLQTVNTYTPEEAKYLLQFAVNFLMTVGSAAAVEQVTKPDASQLQ